MFQGLNIICLKYFGSKYGVLVEGKFPRLLISTLRKPARCKPHPEYRVSRTYGTPKNILLAFIGHAYFSSHSEDELPGQFSLG